MSQPNPTLTPPITFKDGHREVSFSPSIQEEMLELVILQLKIEQKREEVRTIEEAIRLQTNKVQNLINEAENEYRKEAKAQMDDLCLIKHRSPADATDL
jgi:hypothetical protein